MQISALDEARSELEGLREMAAVQKRRLHEAMNTMLKDLADSSSSNVSKYSFRTPRNFYRHLVIERLR